MKSVFFLTLGLLLISNELLAQEYEPTIIEYEDKVPGSLMVEFGFAYDSDYPDGMEMVWNRSRTFNLYYMYDIKLFGSKTVTLNPGFGLGVDNYSLKNGVGIEEGSDSLDGVFYRDQVIKFQWQDILVDESGNSASIRHSKINPIYLDIPLELRFHSNPTKKAFRFAIGGKFGFRIDSKTKVKYSLGGDTEKIKKKADFHISQFRYGAYVRFGYGPINFFVYRQLSGLFVESSTVIIGNNFSPWVYGLTLVTF